LGDDYTETFNFKLDWKFASKSRSEVARQEALEIFNKKLTDERKAASASTAAYQDRMMEEEFSAFEARLEAEFAAQEIMAEIEAEAARQEALEVFNKKLIDERASSAKFTAAYQSKRANDSRIAALMNEITIQNEIALFELKLEAELAAQEMMIEIEAELNQ